MNYRVNNAGFIQIPEDWSLTPARTRNWNDLDLWYLKTGGAEVNAPEGTFKLIPGSCLLIRGGQDYTFRHDPDKVIKHYWVHFDCLDESGNPVSPEIASVPSFFHQVQESRGMEFLLERLVSDTENQNRLGVIWLQAILRELELLESEKNLYTKSSKTIDVAWIHELCRQIDEEPRKKWSVSGLAEKNGYSRSYFYRLFLDVTGQSPQDYIISARMRMARYLLKESGNSITWISNQLGYTDIFFFSKHFKTINGVSPSEYREKY